MVFFNHWILSYPKFLSANTLKWHKTTNECRVTDVGVHQRALENATTESTHCMSPHLVISQSVYTGIFRSQMNRQCSLQAASLILWSQYKHLGFRPQGETATASFSLPCRLSDNHPISLLRCRHISNSCAFSILVRSHTLQCWPPVVQWPVSTPPAVPPYCRQCKTGTQDLFLNHNSTPASQSTQHTLQLYSNSNKLKLLVKFISGSVRRGRQHQMG